MLNQYAVDNPTSSRSWWNAKPFSGNAEPQKMGRQVFGTHMVNRETFLQIQQRLLQHLIRKSWIHGVLMCQNTQHHMWWVKAEHQFRIREASQDRQPEIQSSLVREYFSHIDSRNHLADILTMGHFTRDEWNHLLKFFNNSFFSSQNGSEAMARRQKEGDHVERVDAKSKPVRKLVSIRRTSSSTVPSSTSSSSPVNFVPNDNEVRIHAGRLNAKEIILPKGWWRFHISGRRWNRKTLLEEIRHWKHPPW